MLPFPAGTAVCRRPVAWLPKMHFTVPCDAATASSNEMQLRLCCGSYFATKWIVSLPAVLEAVDSQL